MEDKKQENSSDILGLAKSLTESWGGRIFIGLALLLLANQTFGDPVGKYMDRKFEIQSQEQENTYNLQLRTIEIMEESFDEVASDIKEMEMDLKEIQEIYRDHEERISDLEENHENE